MLFPPPTRRPHRPGAPRRGTILIVVLALLGLFAVVGLGFVLFASNEADISRVHREREARGGSEVPAPDPSDAVNQFLSALIYDTGDDLASGALYNTVRGHGLLRAMYGWSGASAVGTFPNQTYLHTTAYNGVGTFHEKIDISPVLGQPAGTTVIDRSRVVNYGYIPFGPNAGLQMDPEYDGFRYYLQSGAPVTGGTPISSPPAPGGGRTYVARNAPYTYPDLKDFYLGSFVPTTGEVTVPSFYRNWVFDPATNPTPNVTPPAAGLPNGALAPNNPYWLNPLGRLFTVRPRPVDQLTQAEIQSVGLPYPLPVNLTAGQQATLAKLIDAKIKNGEIFPYPAANLDGTYTGDVKNLLGGYAPPSYPGMTNSVHKNDSIWMDVGLPVRTWNGKQLKPLVAALILDLDGRVNLNAHGNLRASNAHASYAGLGPWEISLAQVLGPADAAAVIQARQGNNTPFARRNPFEAGTHDTLWFDKTKERLPLYAQVNWDGTTGGLTTGSPVQLPTFAGMAANPFATAPVFGGGFNDNIHDTADPSDPNANHPGLFNPHEWSPMVNPNTPRTFPGSDLKVLSVRFGDKLDKYRSAELARLTAPFTPPFTTLIGTETNPAKYRLDPAHNKRQLVTTLSMGLDRPGLMPNFPNVGAGMGAAALGYDPATKVLSNPWFGANFPPAVAAGPNAVGDFQPGLWRQNRAGLGPIDLTRPLTDYRDDTTKPVQPNNVSNPTGTNPVPNSLKAWADRHNLARDIFARLILATGAMATVVTQDQPAAMPTPLYAGDVVVTADPTANPNEYAALRYLAQVAANIVDYIDPDEVSTPFVWNPVNPNAMMGGGPNLPLQAIDATTFFTDPTKYPEFLKNFEATPLAMGSPIGNIHNRVVFGTEKPKLVINETYAEVTNAPNEATNGAGLPPQPPQNPAHVRFWVELLNPTSTPYAASSATDTVKPQLGDGSARLRYDAVNDKALISGLSYSPYTLVIARATKNINMMFQDRATFLADPANVMGQLNPQYAPEIVFDFSVTDGATAARRVVTPNNGNYNPITDPSSTGIALVGPQIPPPGGGGTGPQSFEFNPAQAGAVPPWTTMIAATQPANQNPNQNAMAYQAVDPVSNNGPPTEAEINNPQFRRHVVLLRRLANPHLPPNDPANATGLPTHNPALPPYNPALPPNPYITVDMMDHTTAWDAVNRAKTNGTQRMAKSGMGNGYDPITSRQALGRVQPYAGGSAAPTIGNNGQVTFSAAFPNTFVLPQRPNPPLNGQPQHTFGRHNGIYNTTPTPPMGQTTITPSAGGDTILAPFDWLVHLDRPLQNVLELLDVRAGKPHELTQLFLQPPAGMGTLVRKDAGQVPWLQADPNTYQTGTGLYRALDLVRVKPHGYNPALGGRVPGKININTIQDYRVLMALLDPPAGGAGTGGNVFGTADVFNAATPNDPATLWFRLIGSRTPNIVTRPVNPAVDPLGLSPPNPTPVPIPGRTFDDDPVNGTDRPFRPFGTLEFAMPAPSSPAPYAGGGQMTPVGMAPVGIGPGIQDTLLRLGADPANPADPTARVPVLWLDPRDTAGGGVTPVGLDRSHPYFRAEAARKLFNNVTTTSNTFAVWLTIGFFEVRTDPATGAALTQPTPTGGPARHLLGREAFKEAPGDMRFRYFSLVDRSASTLDPNTAADVLTGAWRPARHPLDPSKFNRPFFSMLRQDVVPPATAGGPYRLYTDPEAWNLAVPNQSFRADGEVVDVYVGTRLLIGVGADQEEVQVSNIGEDIPMTGNRIPWVEVQPVTGQPLRPHRAGTTVTNLRLGNPGPQPTFNPAGNPVTPYFSRVP